MECQINDREVQCYKCPWIGLQLANTKKVQQVIAQPGYIEKYFSERPNSVKLIRSTFAGLWGLEYGDEETKKVIADAIANPDNYVLKPQLEGGGGNYYGDEIPSKLKTMSHDELAAHILMERIKPMVVKVTFKLLLIIKQTIFRTFWSGLFNRFP